MEETKQEKQEKKAEQTEKTPQEKIEEMFEKGILLNEELLKKDVDSSLWKKVESEADLVVLNSDYVDVINQQSTLVDWYDVDKYRVGSEKERDDELYQSQLQNLQNSTLSLEQEKNKHHFSGLETQLEENNSSFTTDAKSLIQEESELQQQAAILENKDEISPNVQINYSVNIIINHENKPKKYQVSDFTNFFLSRYNFIEKILRNRQELQHTMNIGRILNKKEKEKVSLIGLVSEIGETKNGNLILTMEDLTGQIKVVVSKNKKDLFAGAKDLVVDEVIGISGNSGDKIVFVDNIVWPDIPHNELKRSEEEGYAVFLSDVHVGSTLFLHDEFMKFLKWINGETGNDKQKEIAKKVKYVIIAGDLVDGVGIYPSQEEELSITDITGQYNEFTRLIGKIPRSIPIIICPGNHDSVHLAEPQSAFSDEFSIVLKSLPNVTLVTNPALVNLGKTENFSGFNVLLYHGYSFDYYVSNVESIRHGGGYHRSDLIMKFLLKRRHLAPAFRSTPYFPAHKEDPLLIKEVPDFFITGHIHYCSVANYKGVTMISGSCWQAKTTFQEKLGHEPEPARVPVVNLKTREVKIMRFG